MKKRLSELLNILLGVGIIFVSMKQFGNKKTSAKGNSDKMAVYYRLMDKWMKLKEENMPISDYMEQHGFQTIAIYGLSDLGKHLEKELEKSQITVQYAIDRAGVYLTIDLDVYSPESELPPVDAVIVTPVLEYNVICNNLQKKVSCPVLSLSEIINEMVEGM